jgi:pyridoxamine 5'-phosphate oxidase
MASPQSKVIADDLLLASRVDELEKQLVGQAVPRPPQWGGYRLTPLLIEFWQGRPSRLHDRFRYQRSNINTNEWVLERLAP